MITSIQMFFQRHYKWLFGALLVVIVVSFVFAFGPAADMAPAEIFNKKDKTAFFGYDLSRQEVVEGLARETVVGLWLKTGMPPYNANSLQALVIERIIEEDLANKLSIPSPTQEQLSGYIATLPVFVDADGHFKKELYTKFKGDVADQFGVDEKFLSQQVVLRWRLDQVADVMEKANYVLPETLKREYELTQTRYEVVLADLPPQTEPSEPVTDEEVAEFFAKNGSSYMSEEKRSGVYYWLSADKFIDQVKEPTEDQLQDYFDRIAMRFIKWQITDEDGNVTGAEPTAPTLEENRQETLALYKKAKATRAAAEAVNAIVQKIYTDKITPPENKWDEVIKASDIYSDDSENEWNALIKASGVEVSVINSVSESDSVEGIDSKAIDILFTRELPYKAYSEAFLGENAGGFVLLTDVEKPRALTQEEAMQKGLKEDAARNKAAAEFQETIPGTLAGLLSFEDAEAFEKAATDLGFTITKPEVFTPAKPSADIKSADLLKRITQTQVGDVAQNATMFDAQVAYVVMREAAEWDEAVEEAKDLKEQINNGYARMSMVSYLDEWSVNNAEEK